MRRRARQSLDLRPVAVAYSTSRRALSVPLSNDDLEEPGRRGHIVFCAVAGVGGVPHAGSSVTDTPTEGSTTHAASAIAIRTSTFPGRESERQRVSAAVMATCFTGHGSDASDLIHSICGGGVVGGRTSYLRNFQ